MNKWEYVMYYLFVVVERSMLTIHTQDPAYTFLYHTILHLIYLLSSVVSSCGSS